MKSFLLERLMENPRWDGQMRQKLVQCEGNLLDILTGVGELEEEEALSLLAGALGCRFSLELETSFTRGAVGDLSLGYLKKNNVVPLSVNREILQLAASDPENVLALDDVAHALRCDRYELVLAPRWEIQRIIQILMHQDEESTRRLIEDLDEQAEEDKILEELHQAEDLLDSTSQAPVIRLVNMVLTQAVKRRASDVHIEPYKSDVQIRYRVDGVLYEVLTLQRRLHPSVVSRIKVLADLNIAEKRLPQDGRIQIKIGDRDIDIRVSVIPTLFGERVVLRLLDKKSAFLELTELGFSLDALRTFEKLIRKSHGIILVTGPTGSGKTTTLYSALSRINSRDKNIVTVEDPIEYQLQGIGQIQVAPKIGLTFATGLRSILRHDPDVIMIGEIRDREAAEIAIQASLTGHLVFSTLHTNDSSSAMTRLVDMGIEPFLITSSVQAVMAQRLIRLVCSHCRRPDEPAPEVLHELGMNANPDAGVRLYRGSGCDACFGTGYLGRTCINEILVLDDSIRRLVLRSSDASEVKKYAVSKGMVTLREDGIRKISAGLTSVEEVLRVTQE